LPPVIPHTPKEGLVPRQEGDDYSGCSVLSKGFSLRLDESVLSSLARARNIGAFVHRMNSRLLRPLTRRNANLSSPSIQSSRMAVFATASATSTSSGVSSPASSAQRRSIADAQQWVSSGNRRSG